MPTIQEMIQEYVEESPKLGRLETRQGKPGILFLDEYEFIPFDDLGFNPDLGFYQLSRFPNVKNEAG